ncbi:MAG: hypothetical protein IPG92_08935 [Flavobacteriales bacterium]|nr:hypothetical protein [Flavobacteriales bacterium]
MEFAPIAAGDRTAFEALFRLHYRPLCAFAVQYVKDADKAEDLVQDLFFRLWLDRAKLTITTSLKAYLFASVRNRCLNAVKSAGRVVAARLGISVKTVENQMGKALKTLRDELSDLVPLLPWLFWISEGGG